MRESCTSLIADYIKNDKRVIALTADSRNGILDTVRSNYPSQYIDYGIAESNMLASSAGLATCGKIPFVFGTSTFISMRAYEYIRNDICLANKNVKLIGIFCGLCRGSWGATHQGTEELALLRGCPNLTVITPLSPIEAREATRYAYESEGPVYIRLEASGEPEYLDNQYRFTPGKSISLNTGNDITIITMGSIASIAIAVARSYEQKGISIRVISMSTVNPIDKRAIIDAGTKTRGIISLEEHNKCGGLGSAIAECIAENEIHTRLIRIGLDGFAKGCGERSWLRENNNIGQTALCKAVEDLL